MLAALAAAAARPHGAPRWDAPGISAAIFKVKHLALGDVMRAVANAADDRDAQTPGVIANMRSACWQDRPMRPAPLEVLPPEHRCGICGKSRRRACESSPRFADDDHRFEADFHVQARELRADRCRTQGLSYGHRTAADRTKAPATEHTAKVRELLAKERTDA